ncbi:MAG: septum formation initiator family protein [Candidatus Eisenbacteria bacterium]|nr:septum formation initiator family protein [Candidatus Eisenbacteria bacterium]
MPSATGENRRRVTKKEEPRFLRKKLKDQGRGATTRVLKILGWTLAIWFVSAILLGDSGLVSIVRMKGMKRGLQDEIEALEQARDEAAAYNEDLRSDPDAVEKVAREEYGMIKEGEICYRVVLEDEE